jgi:hypothetical protein
MMNDQIAALLNLLYSLCYALICFRIFHYSLPAMRISHRWHATGLWGIGAACGLMALAGLFDAWGDAIHAKWIYHLVHPFLISAFAIILLKSRLYIQSDFSADDIDYNDAR